MKSHLTISLIIGLAVAAATSFAIDPFPNQPKMSAAYNKLSGALAQVEKSRLGEPAKHKKGALVNLAMARNFLEDAAKNKGSYRPTAIRLIEQATQELEATPADEKHTDRARDLIKEAMEAVSRGARAARR